MKESNDRLRNIASFLHAFNLKNAACFLNLECSDHDDNSLQSFFVDSGYTSTQLRSALPIGYLDGYHFKTPNFTFQILALTLQEITGAIMIAALAIVPIENIQWWT
jgi:hypothetical protein